MRLSPVQRAYLLGYRRAKAQARREMREMLDELTHLQEDISGISNDYYRYKAARVVERDPNAWATALIRLRQLPLLSFYA